MTTTRAPFVRYSSPFGTPSARMPREEAERHLAEDDARWLTLGSLLSEEEHRHGPPFIEELPR